MNAFNFLMQSAKNSTVSKTTEKGIKRKRSASQSCKVQLCLNLGQRGLAPTICEQCGMTYSKGVKEDDVAHNRFHSKVTLGIPFKGWKEENILLETEQHKVLFIEKKDFNKRWGFLSEILRLVFRDLGGVPNFSIA